MSHINRFTAEDIYNDPFGYTYEEYSTVLGENAASDFYGNIYSSPKKSKYKTIKSKEVLRGRDTNKYVFELSDGYCIETVCIKRRTGTTVCVSTMVGCPVGCVFCASGENGFIRNLTPSEIVQQVIFVEEKVNRIVYMGMGEPLLNYDNVIKSIHILRDRRGLDFPTDGITISTVGPLNQLKKLREEHLKIHLTLSLHATNQTTRNRVLPHMKSYRIEDIVESVLDYSERHNRMVTIAYLLIPGVNDHMSDVKQLGKWFRNKNVLINLLQYNETNYQGIRRPNKQELVAFRDKLNNVGLTVKIRESRGGKIKAACGQLVSKRNKRSDNQQHKNKMSSNRSYKTQHIAKTKTNSKKNNPKKHAASN